MSASATQGGHKNYNVVNAIAFERLPEKHHAH